MRLAFAGGEAWFDTLVGMGVKNVLFSYFYFRDMLRRGTKAIPMLQKMRAAQRAGYFFMLDSGAYTYQAKAGKVDLPKPEEYFDEYYRFCQEYGDIFEIIAELDIDQAVTDPKTGKPITIDKVDAWTNVFLTDPVLGPKTMPVWHPHRGHLWLDSWLEDPMSPYIGISSGTGAENVGITQSVIAKCHRWGKFVHGFGQTRIKTDLKFTTWDSIDSTTWLRADKYGGTCIFQNNQFIVLDHKHKADRGRYKQYFERWGLDYKKVMADDLETMRLSTIIAWRELATFLEQQDSRRKPPYLWQMFMDGKRPTIHPKKVYDARQRQDDQEEV